LDGNIDLLHSLVRRRPQTGGCALGIQQTP